MNPVTTIVTLILWAVSIAHLLRILLGVRVTVADAVIPMWISGVGFVVAAVLAIMLGRHGPRNGS